MIIRLIFASLFTLVLLGLIPYLNRSRTAKELPIVSYRLHSFETKNIPTTLPEPKSEVEVKLEKAVTISTAIPQPKLQPLSMPINAMISSNLKFTASTFSGSYAKGGELASGTESLIQSPPVLELNFQPDGGDHLLFGPKPITPLRARQLGLNGTVMAQFEVNEKGLVENVKVLKSTTEIFDKPVISAIKQYRFKPYIDQKGNLIKVLLTKEFLFEVH